MQFLSNIYLDWCQRFFQKPEQVLLEYHKEMLALYFLLSPEQNSGLLDPATEHILAFLQWPGDTSIKADGGKVSGDHGLTEQPYASHSVP